MPPAPPHQDALALSTHDSMVLVESKVQTMSSVGTEAKKAEYYSLATEAQTQAVTLASGSEEPSGEPSEEPSGEPAAEPSGDPASAASAATPWPWPMDQKKRKSADEFI